MRRFAIAIACGLITAPVQAGAQQPARVTILYDAFGPPSALKKDWGFAALIEYGGRRILFDTGNDAGIFARNVEQLGVEMTVRGNVATDDNYLTSVPNVFAAGDLRRGQSLVVWAIAEGRKAARAIDLHLMGRTKLT